MRKIDKEEKQKQTVKKNKKMYKIVRKKIRKCEKRNK